MFARFIHPSVCSYMHSYIFSSTFILFILTGHSYALSHTHLHSNATNLGRTHTKESIVEAEVSRRPDTGTNLAGTDDCYTFKIAGTCTTHHSPGGVWSNRWSQLCERLRFVRFVVVLSSNYFRMWPEKLY